jgi:hypothetical protein
MYNAEYIADKTIYNSYSTAIHGVYNKDYFEEFFEFVFSEINNASILGLRFIDIKDFNPEYSESRLKIVKKVLNKCNYKVNIYHQTNDMLTITVSWEHIERMNLI